MKEFFVYILKCSDGSYYVGHTDNLEKRLSEYNNNCTSGYVSRRLPITLVFHEGFGTRYEALSAEMKLKGWSRKKKKALIEGGWENMIGIWRRHT